MKAWGNEGLAQGFADDELYTYHMCIIVKNNIVVAVMTRNKK